MPKLQGRSAVEVLMDQSVERIAEGLLPLKVPIASLQPDPDNANVHPEVSIEQIAESLRQYGQQKPIVVRRQGMVVIAGNGTLEAAKRLGWTHIAANITDMDTVTAVGFGLADNRTAEFSKRDPEVVLRLSRLIADAGGPLVGWTLDELDAIRRQLEDEARPPAPSLADRFGVPPFTVLDARQGYWQERKRQWLGLGIQSELGRDATTYNSGSPGDLAADFRGGSAAQPARNKLAPGGTGKHTRWFGTNGQAGNDGAAGTSVFDPVLCELVYRWFSPPKGHVLDPFAGGSVRGIVASKLGRHYTGIDLSAGQVQANDQQAADICQHPMPCWIIGDSCEMLNTKRGHVKAQYDLVFTCPPYFDLEQYSDDPADLSNMDWDKFKEAYERILELSVGLLADDRFFCVVVGEVREDWGAYRGLVTHTITSCEDFGLRLYNHAILVTAIGSLPIRVGKQFTGSRKLGATHQHVLVFVKGDPKKATDACGQIDVVELDQFLTEEPQHG